MDILQAMETRHSVRRYLDQPIESSIVEELTREIEACNRESGLSMQLFCDDASAFSGVLGKVWLRGCRNFLVLAGRDEGAGTELLDELCGYYGERVVLRATQLGLASCWYAMGTSKATKRLDSGERMVIVVALGYGATTGKPHKSKSLDALYQIDPAAGDVLPEWFERGVRAAQLAPTAVNQQKFCFTLLPKNKASASTANGSAVHIDLGIAKYHFEIAAGLDSFRWA